MAIRKSSQLLPEVFRTSKNAKFLNATVDQLISEDNKKKFSGFIGRKNAENFLASDKYLTEISALRQNYQLEPGVVYEDASGNVKSVSSIFDALNTIHYNNGKTSNQDSLYKQEYYNWSGFIDFDKLINYGEYFWLPGGPDSVQVIAGTVDTTHDYTVLREGTTYKQVEYDSVGYDEGLFDERTTAVNTGGLHYIFDNTTASPNPTLYLARGGTYTFKVDQPGIPFWIQTETGTDGIDDDQVNISTREVEGVINNGEDDGTVTWNVPMADAQSEFTGMTTDAFVDLATPLTYSQLQNQTLSSFLETYTTGIDGLTEIDGKTLIFTNDSLDETEWNAGALFDAYGYDSGTVEGGDGTFDPVTALSLADRYGVFRIDVNSIDSVDTIQLSLIQSITNKVYIKQGVVSGSREYWKDSEGFLRLIPNITAGQNEFYYQDADDENRFGKIILVTQGDNAAINVETDILGRETYTSPNGVDFTNGLKVEFDTSVTPTGYQNNTYYVEGIGTSIKLIKISDLVTPETYTKTESEPFDSESFDVGGFETSKNNPTAQDYITSNRSSGDRNAWSRGNRWFHRSVITKTAEYNKFTTVIDDNARAKRPIIEFDPGLRLFNMGITSKSPVDIIDTVEIDAFSNVNGTASFYSDGINLTPGRTVCFTKDPEIQNNIYRVDLIDHDSSDSTDRIINLVKVDSVVENDCMLSVLGATNQGKMFWYTTDSSGNAIWKETQQKTGINQEPLFDVFDGEHVSLSDTTKYPSTNFAGNKLFSYKRNTSANADTVLGFGLTYKNIDNVGDILFDNNYINDKFSYTKSTGAVDVIIRSGHVHKYNGSTKSLHNGWTKIRYDSRQWQQVQHVVDTELYVFEIGSDPKEITGEITLQVFVNGTYQTSSKYTRLDQNDKYYVSFGSALAKDDVVLIRVYSDTVNKLGFYEIPENLENNANNEDFSSLTLGQCRNHFVEMTRGIVDLTGTSLGTNNVRDLNYKNYGGKILQHSAGVTIAHYLLGSDNNLFVNSMTYSLQEYTRFKNRLLDNIDKLDIDLRNPSDSLDDILIFMTGTKSSDFPFYYTDMLPWGSDKTTTTYVLDQTAERTFTFTTQFDLTEISNRCVLVYLTDAASNKKNQLVYGHDYTFDTVEASVTLNADINLAIDDTITIVEYPNTNGSFIPPTPSKLGLYPKFEPKITLDDTYQTGTSAGTGPFKIYGTANDRYTQNGQNETGWFYPLYTTQAAAGGASASHTHKFLGSDRVWHMPTSNAVHAGVDSADYTEFASYTPVILGHDGSRWVAYKDIRDLIILEFEKRVYNNIKSVYDKNTFDLADIQSGYFRDTESDLSDDDFIISKYFASWAHKNAVVWNVHDNHSDANGFTWNYSQAVTVDKGWRMPGYWRGIYRWLYDTETPHLTPWEMLGLNQKPTWWEDRYGKGPYTRGNYVLWEDIENGKVYSSAARDATHTIDTLRKRPGLTDIIPVDEQGSLLEPNSFLVQGALSTNTTMSWKIGDCSPAESAWRRSSEWPFVVQILAALKRPAKYFTLLWDTNLIKYNSDHDQILQLNKSYRPKISDYKLNGTSIGSTTSINRIEGYNQFIENYYKHRNLNISNLQTEIQNLSLRLVYPMSGYTNLDQSKLIIESTTPSSTSNNIFIPDENVSLYLNKSTPIERVVYTGINIVKKDFGYEVIGFDIDNPFFKIIPSKRSQNSRVVTIGNKSATLYDDGENYIANIPYGTTIATAQQVSDFLIAYQRYLNAKGYVFDSLNDQDDPKDFTLAAKEFLFWDQQGWGVNSVLGISPANNEIKINRLRTTLDDISKFGAIKNPNGITIKPTQYDVSRIDNETIITVDNQRNSIYAAQTDPIQYEHYLVLDNTTIFNDVIYQPELGNRQSRIKFVGYKSSPWNGTLHAPGFIINKDEFNLWVENTDYKKGDIVSHNKTLYVAVDNHVGEVKFDYKNWRRVNDMKTGLLPNITQKADRFTAFYNIDDSNLESSTDVAAKGQIGFRPREYLDQLGLDDVSQVKFYQGMIRNKGTKNVVEKLINADLTNLDQEINVYEEWGIRVGAYGSIDSNQVIELIVDEAEAQESKVVVELLNDGDTTNTNRLSYSQKDLFKTPVNYTKDIFLTRSGDVKKTDIVGAGYPRIDDTDFTIFDIDKNLSDLNENLDSIGRGTTIWAVKDIFDWDIFRVSEVNAEIIAIEQQGDEFVTYTTNTAHGIVAKDKVVIKSSNAVVGGFKTVLSTTGATQFTITIDQETTIDNIDSLRIPVFKLVSTRFSNTSNIATYTPHYGWEKNEIAWVDYDENQKWAAFRKNNPWDYKNLIYNIDSSGNGLLGSSLAVSDDSLTMFTGAPEQSTGVVYPYLRDQTGTYTPITAIAPSDITGNVDALGYDVASGDQYTVIGAPSSDSSNGYMFVYIRTSDGTPALRQNIRLQSPGASAQLGYNISMSKDDRYLFASAPGENKVHMYTLVPVATANESSQTIIGDGSDVTFTLTNIPSSIDAIFVEDGNTKEYMPYKDYTLSGSTLTFTTPPANTLNVVIRQRSYYKHTASFTGSDSTAGDQFGYNIDTDTAGETVIVGAPFSTVASADSTLFPEAGEAYLFHHIVERFTGDGVTTAFTTTNTLPSNIYIEVDGVTQNVATGSFSSFTSDSSENSYTLSGNTVNFRYRPAIGSIIRVYTGNFAEIQRLDQAQVTGQTLGDSENFGLSVGLDAYGAVAAVGSPGEDETNPNTGSAFVFIDEGLRFGNVTTVNTDKTTFTTQNDSIFVDDFEVVMNFDTSSDPARFATPINNSNDLVNVNSVLTGEGQVKISTTSTVPNKKLKVRPGTGSTFRVLAEVEPFKFTQKINHPLGNENENFGKNLTFDKHIPISNSATQRLIISSDRASTLLSVAFDRDTVTTSSTYNDALTTFDNDSTKFIDRVTQSGAAYIYDLLDSSTTPGNVQSITNSPLYAYGQQLQSVKINELDQFGGSLALNMGRAFIGSPQDDEWLTNAGSVYYFENLENTSTWEKYRTQASKVDPSIINRVVTYDKVTETIIDYIDTVDIFKNKLPGIAQDELDFILPIDPAAYNVSTIPDQVTYVENNNWNDEKVGRLWWDISTCRVIEYEQGDVEYRVQHWNQFFPGSTVDIYEWIESDVLPSQHVNNDLPGTPKYPDDSAYSVSLQYNSSTNTTVTKYYYWVTGLNSFPDDERRHTSTEGIRQLIEDPTSTGIKYLSLIDTNVFIMNNMTSTWADKNTVLSINYDKIKNEGVVHSEFDLVSEGDPKQILPAAFKSKLIDSLAGADKSGAIVPDALLSLGERYGIAIRPRQTIFKNRQQALKNFVDYCNKIFLTTPITRQFELTSLFVTDPTPTLSSGAWNKKVADITTRDFLDTLTLSAGYKVLVESDSTLDGDWGIYSLKVASDNTRTWFLEQVQAYNTARYWDYTTWYATGYDDTLLPKFTVASEPDLLTLTSAVTNDIAKVLSNDDGNFSFFKLASDGTWTEIIIEKGTIKILGTIYDFSNATAGSYIGFDSGVFDFEKYDRVPHQEVRNIATSIFDNIFVDTLADKANELFFRMIEYALHETQITTRDWLIKTSFIRVLHKIRDLKQYPTYLLDNSTFIEEYINEVKPYHTNIREYVATYDGDDTFQGDVTDFDLHSFYDTTNEYFRKPSGDFGGDEITRTQNLNKPWSDNYTYYIDSLVINSAGTGYLDNPTISISAPDVSTGTQATATAVTNGDSIVSITVVEKGSGYTKNPTITVTGQGSGLDISPRIQNDAVREFDTTLKFDRITYSSTVTDWTANTSYDYEDLIAYYNSSTGIQEVYQVSATGGFTSGATFSVENTAGIIILTPYTDASFTNAADRIAAYYVPTSGMIGDDLELLQPGTGYGGNKVTGLGFDREPGFDSANYDILGYDDFSIDSDGLAVVGGIDTQIKSTFSNLALGTAPEDIDIDGGKFVDVENSHAPEEVIPGIVFDNLDIEVYTDPSDDFTSDGNSFKTTTRVHTADGLVNKFSFANTSRKELVDYLVVYQGSTRIHDYTADYEGRTVSFASTPAAGTQIHIYGFGTTGEKLVHEEMLIGDGSTAQYTLGVEYTRYVQSLVLRDGISVDHSVSNQNNRVTITINDTNPDGSVIHAFVSNRAATKPAFTYGQTQTIELTGGTLIYDLDQSFDDDFAQPTTGNMIVELGNERLRCANSEYYTLDGSTTAYLVPGTAEETAANVSSGDIVVTRIDNTNNVTVNLNYLQDFTISQVTDASSTLVWQVNLLSAYNNGDSLIVSVENSNEYFIDAGKLRLNSSLSFSTGDKIYVTTFNNHDPLRIHTKVFIGQGSDTTTDTEGFDESVYDSTGFDETTLTGGVAKSKYTMDRTPAATNNLWVTLDGVRLHPGEFTIDTTGRIDLSIQTVTASSEIIVTHFSENIIEPTLGYRMVNDMLGNYEYFRLCNDRQTTLATDLVAEDTKIYVEDATKLPLVSRNADNPGVLYVGNERITYWEISHEDHFVTGIRRGTNGTRFAPRHIKGTEVYDTTEAQRLPATNTHTQTWYDVGTSTAANGFGLQSSSSTNAEFLKACEASLPNYISEFQSPKYVDDGYVDESYIEELDI
jgi:hypothetical protein